jgi:hydroxypyruvate reductase
LAIVRAGVAAVDAGRLTTQALTPGTGPIRLIAAGKAAPAMARAALDVLGSRVSAGLVVGVESSPVPAPLESIVGGHPMPSPASENAGSRALAIAGAAGPDEELLVLLSGGASALMAAPAEGLTLDDKRRTTDTLLRAGADIHALNTVRKHLSRIKGGQLAARTLGRCRTLAISDVVGDDLSFIASGPTVPDPTKFEDALEVLRRFGGLDAYPLPVVAHLTRGVAGRLPETPKPGDPRLARAASAVIGGRRDAMIGAADRARVLGYHVVVYDAPVVGEARTAAQSHLRYVEAAARAAERPLCVVSSGETTVRVRGSGRGGRNQEFALAAVELVSSLGSVAAASIGTDGIDGPTDAAGALVDSTTRDRARAGGLDPADFLRDNNAYAFFAGLGDLIHTGPTGTNVGDLQVFLVA